MGHLFRTLNFIQYLDNVGEKYIVLINDDEKSILILQQKNIQYEIVDYQDTYSCWECAIVKKYSITVWLLDRFATERILCEHVKNQNILLVGIDDCGEGAELIDLHFCSMLFQSIKGRKVVTGKEYLILNNEIKQYRRQREMLRKVVITMGGSDTYGVTVKVIQLLQDAGIEIDVIVGPNFSHMEELKQVEDKVHHIFQNVSSLIEKMADYDLAVTGGGITCFEACASGLPCIIIANEIHEIEIGKYVESFGGAIFAGYYQNIDRDKFDLKKIDICNMSKQGAAAFTLNGAENIYNKIKREINGAYKNE